MSHPPTPSPAFPIAQAVESLREGFVLTDSDIDSPGPRILHANTAFLRMTGYSLEEVLGRSPRFLQGPESDRRVLDRLRHCLKTGERFEGQTINYRKDGQPFMMQWYVEPVRDPSGHITQYFAVQRDVTDSLSPDRSLEARKQVVAQLPEGVLIFDPFGRVRYANDAYLSWSDLSYDEVVRRPVWKLPGAPERRSELRWARKLLSIPREWKREYTIRGLSVPKYRRFVFINIFPIRSPEGQVVEFLAMLRDVTELQRLRSIAEAQNFHNNLGMVFSGVRHELGNPVNSIKTALQVVRDHLHTMPEPKLRDYLDRMSLEVGRMEFMLRSLRAYNLYERPHMELLDIQAFLKRFRPLAESALQSHRAKLEIEVAPDVDTVWADPQALHQVLLNLLNNAAKAVSEVPHGLVTIHVERAGDHCLLSIRDNGEGIPPEILENVFKPFYTTNSDGNGLGLAICRHLLSLMRASIELESSPKGTEATLVLDRQEP